jgi:hypothetical protein
LNSPQLLFQNSDWQNKKISTAISATLDERRLQEFSQQLDRIIEAIRETNEKGDSSDVDRDSPNDSQQQQQQRPRSSTSTTDRDTLEKARLLQSQIQNRQALLDRLERQPYWFNYFAAFIGSIASTLIMHPVDTIKTRLMMASSGGNDDNDSSSFLWKSDNRHTNTTATTSLQDIGSLYQGLTGNLWKEGPPSAVYLGVYETVKYAMVPRVPQQSSYLLLLVYLMAGAAGELVGSILRAPAEATKSLVQSRSSDGALQAVRRVLLTDSGRETLFRAWQASLCRDVPFGAIQLAMFEFVKASILNNPSIDFDSSTLQAEAIIGAFAGGFGAFLTNPADVITTRIITAEENSNDGTHDKSRLNAIGMARTIYAEEGSGAFLVGWQARVGYWAPAISIFLTCYCTVRQAGIKYDWFP